MELNRRRLQLKRTNRSHTLTSYSRVNTVISQAGPIKSIIMRWARNLAGMGYRRGSYNVSFGKHEGKRRFVRPRSRWEDIKMDLQEVGCGGHGMDQAGSG